VNARANAAAAAVIVAAGLLSAAWAFIVPIFQATDEAAHFDYAAEIFSAGRLIATPGARTAWIVSPYTRYLLGSTDYFRVAFHSSMRPPPGYGTVAYYRRLDANAPNLQRAALPAGEVSYIASSYPFGFYALEAVWMRLAAAATGSLVATFFAARLLCVLLMTFGLFCNYGTVRNIGIPPWTSVALVAAVGFFPLTTLVSSYVQPDNLAYALVSLTLLLATQLGRGRRPFATTAVIGIALACLAVTKYHFFVSVAVPVGLLIVARLWTQRARLATVLARLLLLAVPSAALLAVQLAFATPTYASSGGGAPLSGLFGPFYDALQFGIAPAIGYLAHNTLAALLDFFVTGPNAATYWGELGLWDAPLVIVNQPVELAIRAVIAVASIVVAATLVFRYARNAARLCAVARRRGIPSAALLATSDPLLNAYVFFAVIMFALYVASNNAYGAAGRQWYPYVFAPFFCAAWYAPRTFPKARRMVPALAAVAFAYAVVASGFATAAILHRYYGPSDAAVTNAVPRAAQIAPDDALGFLWPIQGIDFHPLVARSYRVAFAPGARLWAGGAAIFPARHRAADAVAVVIDGRYPAATIARQYNFQIGEATHDLTYAYSGFFGTFGTVGLDEGAHVVTAFAHVPDSGLYQAVMPARLFFIMRGTHFSDAFLDRLERAPAIAGSLEPVQRCSPDTSAVTGRLADAPRAGSAIWLSIDGAPYAASLRPDGRSFDAAISIHTLAPGTHRVAAYLADPPGYRRIGEPAALDAGSQPRRFSLAWSVPVSPQCARALAGGAP